MSDALRIDADLVRHVARLARLRLTDDEVESMAPQLARILAHVQQVGALETGAHDPATQPPLDVDGLRDDQAGPTLRVQDLLAIAPAHDGAFLVVPRFFEEEDPEA